MEVVWKARAPDSAPFWWGHWQLTWAGQPGLGNVLMARSSEPPSVLWVGGGGGGNQPLWEPGALAPIMLTWILSPGLHMALFGALAWERNVVWLIKVVCSSWQARLMQPPSVGAGQREGGWRRPAELPEGSPPAHQDEVSPSGYTDWAFSAAVDPHMKRDTPNVG